MTSSGLTLSKRVREGGIIRLVLFFLGGGGTGTNRLCVLILDDGGPLFWEPLELLPIFTGR